MLTRDGFDMIKVLKNYSAKSERRDYNCSLHIQEGEKKINMKSIMGMTILKLQQGTSLELIADGSDEQLAAGEIAGCFECD